MKRVLMAGTFAVLVLAGCGDDNSLYSQLTLNWFSPECEVVEGFPVATFSADGGMTIKPNTLPNTEESGSSTNALAAASERAGLLFAQREPHIYYSTDAGCSWKMTDVSAQVLYHLVATDHYGYVVTYTNNSGDVLNRIAADGSSTSYELPFLPRDIATTPTDVGRIYLLRGDGTIYRSDDLGETLVEHGTGTRFPELPQRLYINPRDSLHFVVTGDGRPGVSFDGGVTWTESAGIFPGATDVFTSSVVFGGAGQGEVWMIGGSWAGQNGLFRSLDGGLTFEPVRFDGEGIVINYARTMATAPGVFGEVVLAHVPGDNDEVLGTHLYRASDDTLTPRYYTWDGSCGISALLFHPEDAGVLYLGKASPGCSMNSEQGRQ